VAYFLGHFVYKPKFHLARHDTTLHVRRRARRDERVEPCLVQRDGWRRSSSARVYGLVFCALHLHQFQEQLVENVRWTCPPLSTLWQCPWTRVVTSVSRRAVRQTRHVTLRHVTTFFCSKMHGLDSVTSQVEFGLYDACSSFYADCVMLCMCCRCPVDLSICWVCLRCSKTTRRQPLDLRCRCYLIVEVVSRQDWRMAWKNCRENLQILLTCNLKGGSIERVISQLHDDADMRVKISRGMGGWTPPLPGKQGTPWKRWSKKLGASFNLPASCMWTLFSFSACLVYFHKGVRMIRWTDLGEGRGVEWKYFPSSLSLTMTPSSLEIWFLPRRTLFLTRVWCSVWCVQSILQSYGYVHPRRQQLVTKLATSY